ncbi:MAG: acylphosphatase, partial [Thioalkalivibrio sp.]|nr:acylphosphatase [Thioalkalivibrio sp.]
MPGPSQSVTQGLDPDAGAGVSDAASADRPAPHVHGCQRVRVSGQVQGVGFRPFVYSLARRLGLSGWVRNEGHGVEIEVRGPATLLAVFRSHLVDEAPPLAQIDEVTAQVAAPVPASGTFAILPS